MFDTTMPTMKITPSSDCTLIAVPGQVEHRHHADQAERHGEQDRPAGVRYDLNSAAIRK